MSKSKRKREAARQRRKVARKFLQEREREDLEREVDSLEAQWQVNHLAGVITEDEVTAFLTRND